MNNRLFSNLLLFVMLVYFAAYGIYTGARFFYSPYKTETAFLHTVADSCKVSAVAIRDERLLSQHIGDGEYISYVKEDGEVVVSGSVVAEVFSDPQQLVYRSQIENYQSEIALLRRAQQSSEQFLAADSLSNQVDDALGDIIDAVAQRDLDSLRSGRERFQLSLGRYRVSIGRDDDYSERIGYLEGLVDSLTKKLTQDHYSVTVEEGGYFCSESDGYESLLTVDLQSLTADEYRRIIEKHSEPGPGSHAGKIQIGHDWYLAAWVARQDTHRFEKGTMVTVELKSGEGIEIPASVHEVMYDEEQNAVVFLKTNYVSGPLIAMRHADAEIKFRSYTGLRISAGAVRYNGLVEGVYVKNDNVISFKEIKRIYTDEDFVLCEAVPDIDDEEQSQYRPLSQFDEVVVEGTDLYDGKII